jgi:hypothetical protein
METLRIERSGPLAVLRMDKPRANAIDEAFVRDLLEACALLDADPEIRGVLLASAHPKLFCPGLDLVSLVALDRPAMDRFMAAFSDAMLALFALSKPVVAAVSGHAVAGGCILALTADTRLLKRGAQIGLNEVKVGVPLPWSVAILPMDRRRSRPVSLPAAPPSAPPLPSNVVTRTWCLSMACTVPARSRVASRTKSTTISGRIRPPTPLSRPTLTRAQSADSACKIKA